MADRIYDLYVNQERLTIENLDNAIKKGWITEEQKAKMIADLEAKKASEATASTNTSTTPQA